MGSELKVHLARAFFTAAFALGANFFMVAFAFLGEILAAFAFLAFFTRSFAFFLGENLATRAFFTA